MVRNSGDHQGSHSWPDQESSASWARASALTCDTIGGLEGEQLADLRLLMSGWADLRTTGIKVPGGPAGPQPWRKSGMPGRPVMRTGTVGEMPFRQVAPGAWRVSESGFACPLLAQRGKFAVT
jgi:hypothetical protein